jgi:hypothetical protein
MYYGEYLGLISDYTYQEYAQPTIAPSITNVEGGNTIITTINGGGGGQVSGSVVTISGGTTGLTFVGNNSTLTMSGTLGITNGGTGAITAAGARANFGSAKSGVNDDITMFTALAAVSGFGAWIGTSTKTGQSTYTATADALYNQVQVQALMDKVQQLTEFVKALVDAGHGSGTLRP